MTIVGGVRAARWRTYLVALLITTAIFATALFVSNYLNDKRLEDIRATQDNISIDILSLETQFDLLAEHSCRDIAENSVLSRELRPLAERLSYMERERNVDDEELVRLKRFYSLLQIKDLLLMQRVSTKCGLNPVVILYFYSNEGNCEECENQGYVLTALAQEYQELRIYSFDYNLDLSALQTLVSINRISPELPALVVKDRVYYGFKNAEDIKTILPELQEIEKKRASENATTSE
jgi:hypothetical protein